MNTIRELRTHRASQAEEKLAAGPSAAIGLIKRLVNEGMSTTIEATSRAEVQADGILLGRHRDEITEGISSFMEKRAPKFEGAAGERKWSEDKYK